MMTEEKRIEWLLELQDHPEQLTDEQLQQILADDEMRHLVQQLGFAKRAFKHDELKSNTPDVDAEWEKFAASHANELTNIARAEGKLACTMPCKEEEDESQLDALDEEKPKSHFHIYLFSHKIAASFIGVLLASGIAFAAIQVVRNISTPKPQLPSTEQVIDTKPVTSLPADTVKTDTIPTEPYVFNNVPLDSMLTAIAVAHNMQVEFENEAARHLRFHFVWKREDSLSRVVEKLNTFEAVNIGMEDKTLVVK
ncbi:DUF4974 domain-containing protein [Segatella bryantii]|uniref:Protein FecR C-terminal domain-containing protein n=1 Tax=Segatella bryantii TaxID=77095 RepID=A0ABX4EF36_SEGBR|nr:DUF4974 domain-containing protein [Segatella bryantii]OYP53062.1 hypothetical protein CIK91_13895 [Segatella bryantii]UKK82192.1 DUF4974 domain-containing protein [Segatella bryantii]